LEVIAAQVVKEFDPNHQLAELTILGQLHSRSSII
jgi:hypothetical protein